MSNGKRSGHQYKLDYAGHDVIGSEMRRDYSPFSIHSIRLYFPYKRV